MRAVARIIINKNPGAIAFATGAEGLAVGLSNAFIQQFTGHAQAA
jgi:hypothetical protein